MKKLATWYFIACSAYDISKFISSKSKPCTKKFYSSFSIAWSKSSCFFIPLQITLRHLFTGVKTSLLVLPNVQTREIFECHIEFQGVRQVSRVTRKFEAKEGKTIPIRFYFPEGFCATPLDYTFNFYSGLQSILSVRSQAMREPGLLDWPAPTLFVIEDASPCSNCHNLGITKIPCPLSVG